MVDIARPVYGEAWASVGEKVSPTLTKIQGGWIQEMMPYQWENFLQNRQDTTLLYMLQKGVPEWDASQEYIAGKSVVTYQTNLYISVLDSTNVLPTVQASWKKLNPSTSSSGLVTIAGGGTGASTAADARTNLGLGTIATATAPTSNGVVVRSAADTLISRSITGTANNIVVTNGDGIAGNISINAGSNVALLNTDSSWTSTGSIRLPSGSTSQQGASTPGRVRFNLEADEFHGAYSDGWKVLARPASAEQTPITDVGNFYTSSNVEGALQEVGLKASFVKDAILSYPDYASASAAVATLPDGQDVEAPDAQGKLSRYLVQSGALVFQRLAEDALSTNYMPAGVGAVERTVQAKLREIVSVKDFGAVGDGVADDTAAIQAAIDVVHGLGGGRLLFSAGTYKVSVAPLTLRDNVQLIGAGSQCTTLDFSAQAAFASNSGFINLIGGGLGALQSVTASASEGATAIQVSGSGIAAGDMIQIRSTEFYDGRPVEIKAVAYAASTAYTKGQIVYANGNWYVCQTAGTTGASTAPSGTSNPITDGTVTWYYAPMVDASYQTPWAATEAITLGELRVTYAGRIYVCVTAGTTGSTEPTATATDSLVTDGSVSWRYVVRYNCRKAEFAQVQNVSGATVYLTQPLRMSYPKSGTASYTVEVAPVSFANAAISGFTINGKGLPNDIVQTGGFKYLFSGSSADIAVDAIWASIDCDDLTFTNIEQVGIKLQSCYDCSVRRFRIINNPKNLESQQYGIWVARGSSNIRISDYYGRNSRHIITTDGSTSLSQDYYRGVPCDIVMTNGSGDGIWQSAVDTHAGALDVVANGGVFNTVSCGVKFRSKRTSVSNFLINSLTDNASGYSDGAFSLYFDGGDCTLSNIETRGGVYGVRISNTSGSSIGGIVGANILVKNAYSYGVIIGNNAWDAFGSINLSNITVQDTKNNYNLFLNGQFSEFVLNGLVSKGGTYGMRTGQLSSFKRFSLNGFSVSDFTNEGLYLENLTNFALSGGVVDKPNTTAAAIRVRNSKIGVLNGITVNMAASSASAHGVFLNSVSSGMTDRVVVDGVQVNLPSGTATGVYIEANATNCTVGPACELRSCTTQIAWNAGTTGRGGYMTGSVTYDPPSLTAGAGTTTTVAVSGAAVGDAVYCSFSNDLQGITLTGYVSAGSTVAVRFQNNTGGTIDLASGTLKVTVVKM